MRKLYEKKEILFAVLWIVLYCVVLGTIRGNFGDSSIYMLLALAVFTACITAFVKANHLEEKYGLVDCDTDTRMYCREMIKRTVAYAELLAKSIGGKKH